MIHLEKLRMERITMRRKSKTESWVTLAFICAQRRCWKGTTRNLYLLSIQLLSLNSYNLRRYLYLPSKFNIINHGQTYLVILYLWVIMNILWKRECFNYYMTDNTRLFFPSFILLNICLCPYLDFRSPRDRRGGWSQIRLLRILSTPSLSPTPSPHLTLERLKQGSLSGNIQRGPKKSTHVLRKEKTVFKW